MRDKLKPTDKDERRRRARAHIENGAVTEAATEEEHADDLANLMATWEPTSA